MQSSSTFIRISGPILEVKKSALINDWENIALGRIRAKRGVGKQLWFVPNTVWGTGKSHNPRKILQFLPLFKLENSILSIPSN